VRATGTGAGDGVPVGAAHGVGVGTSGAVASGVGTSAAVATGPVAGSVGAHGVGRGARTSRGRRGWLVDALAILLLGLVSVTLVGVHVATYQVISPIDEESHIDYTLRAPGWQPTVSGDRWLPETMREEACRGKDRGRPAARHCTSVPLDAATFALGGYASAYLHPPTYYDVTAVVGRGIQRLFGLSSPVTGFRLVGVLWLWAGLTVTYRLGRLLGAARTASVAVCVLIAASPAVFYSDAIVNPDAASVLVGAFVCWAVLRWDRSRSRASWALLVAAGVVSTGVKVQNGIVDLVPAGCLLLLAAWPLGGWVRRGRVGPVGWDRLGRRVGGVAVLGGSALAVAVAWTVLVTVNATLPPAKNPMSVKFTFTALPPGALSRTLGQFVEPLERAYIPAAYASTWLSGAIAVATGLLLAGTVAAALLGTRDRVHRAFAWPLLTVAAVGALLMTAANWLLQHQYLPTISQRYCLTLVPAFAVLLAVGVEHRAQRLALAGVAAASGLVTVVVLLASAG